MECGQNETQMKRGPALEANGTGLHGVASLGFWEWVGVDGEGLGRYPTKYTSL